MYPQLAYRTDFALIYPRLGGRLRTSLDVKGRLAATRSPRHNCFVHADVIAHRRADLGAGPTPSSQVKGLKSGGPCSCFLTSRNLPLPIRFANRTDVSRGLCIARRRQGLRTGSPALPARPDLRITRALRWISAVFGPASEPSASPFQPRWTASRLDLVGPRRPHSPAAPTAAHHSLTLAAAVGPYETR